MPGLSRVYVARLGPFGVDLRHGRRDLGASTM